MTQPALHSSRFDEICSQVIYDTSYLVAAFAMTLGWSLRTQGREHIARSGPALLIANHQSYFDPVLVGLSTRRHLRYLARKGLFNNPAFGWLIRMENAVPIDQEGVGKEGIKTILQQLQGGHAVVVFPEGNRTEDGGLQPMKPGIMLLMKRTQAPIVPVGIAGAYDAWPKSRLLPVPSPLFLPAGPGCIAVSIGKPLDAGPLIQMPREQALAKVYEAIDTQVKCAERLRRKE